MRVLIVEDNKDLAANLQDYFQEKQYELMLAYDGLVGLHLATTERWDVIVLDIMLPGIDGLALCERLRKDANDTTPILMLTARDKLQDKIRGFHSGTDDYLVKPFAMQELDMRLRALHRRATSELCGHVLTVGDLVANAKTMEITRAGRPIELTRIGRKILICMMRASPAMVSRAELEHIIWGEHEQPFSDVLRSHIYSLRRAVDRPFRQKLLHTVRGMGYRLAEEAGNS
jgi:DNA-binding response OmpR family regulator